MRILMKSMTILGLSDNNKSQQGPKVFARKVCSVLTQYNLYVIARARNRIAAFA